MMPVSKSKLSAQYFSTCFVTHPMTVARHSNAIKLKYIEAAVISCDIRFRKLEAGSTLVFHCIPVTEQSCSYVSVSKIPSPKEGMESSLGRDGEQSTFLLVHAAVAQAVAALPQAPPTWAVAEAACGLPF